MSKESIYFPTLTQYLLTKLGKREIPKVSVWSKFTVHSPENI